MKKTKTVAMVCLLAVLACASFVMLTGCGRVYAFDNLVPAGGSQSLAMTAGQDFKILTVTDSHLNGTRSYHFLKKTLENLVEKHRPDFVVFNGDNVDYGDKHLKYLEKIAQFFEEKQIYWALTLGNHDRDPEADGVPLGLKMENDLLVSYNAFNKENGYCLYVQYEAGYGETLDYNSYMAGRNRWASEKYGNYAVQITDGADTVYSVVLMDSGQHRAPWSEENGYIEAYQVAWYQTYMQDLATRELGEFNLENGSFIPSLVFVHQPIPEYALAAQLALGSAETGTVPAAYGFGQNGSPVTGNIQKDGVNNGLFAAMQAVGGTHIFAGHNHINNSSILYEGIWVNYLNRVGRRSGEKKSYPDERVNFSKLITIKAGTYAVEMDFALADGTLTKDLSVAYGLK